MRPFEGAFLRYPVVTNLIIINVLMLIITAVCEQFMGVDLVKILGLYYPGSSHFNPVQIVSHMFMHASITHLFFNMFALYMFGRVLEQFWGGKRFFIYYMVTGLGAAALHTLVNHIEILVMQRQFAQVLANLSPDTLHAFLVDKYPQLLPHLEGHDVLTQIFASSDPAVQVRQLFTEIQTLRMGIPTVGASGAVFGILLAFGVLFPSVVIYLLIPPIPIRARVMVIIYAALELYLGMRNPGSSIAHFAHLGGMLFGYILILYWKRHGFTKYQS